MRDWINTVGRLTEATTQMHRPLPLPDQDGQVVLYTNPTKDDDKIMRVIRQSDGSYFGHGAGINFVATTPATARTKLKELGFTHRLLRLGRRPRARNPGVPHLSTLMAGFDVAPPPDSVDYLSSMPNYLGMMLNDSLGCCTISAIYHAVQVWTHAASKMQTDADEDVLATYETFCGYVDGDSNTDKGGVEQTVLGDWMTDGIPIDSGANNKLAAWFEIDPRNTDDIKRSINECGLCYIGFEVPENIVPSTGNPPQLWEVDPDAEIMGGHAIVLAGYDANTISLISWGQKYQMTWDFFQTYTDEAYALVNQDWVDATGKTPLGLDLDTLVSYMRILESQDFRRHKQH